MERLVVVVLRWALLAAAFRALLRVAYGSFVRVPYRGELEWMEGGMLGHVVRVLHGAPLYVQPGADFTPYIYPPLFSWAGALVCLPFGPSLWALRGLSVLATLLTLGVAFDFARRRTGSRSAGVVAAGAYAATFELSGAWFDVARVDSLFVGCLVLSAHCLLNFRSRVTAYCAALAMIAAVLTKQSGLISAGVLLAYGLAARDNRGRLFVAVTVAGVATAFSALHWRSDGWSTYYLFELPGEHRLLESWIVDFFRKDLLGTLALCTVAALFAAIARMSEARGVRRFDLLMLLLATVLPAWLARFHSGMFENVLMPAHAGLCILAAIGVHRAGEHRAMGVSWSLAMLVVFWSAEFDLDKYLPGSHRAASMQRVVSGLADLPAATWFVENQGFAPDLTVGVGAQGMAMLDVLRGDGSQPALEILKSDVALALASHRYEAIVVSGKTSSTEWFWSDLTRHYALERTLEGPSMLTGWNAHDVQVWRPRAGR